MTKSKSAQASAGERVANGGSTGYQGTETFERIEKAFEECKTVQQVADEFCVTRQYLWKLHGAAIRAMMRVCRIPSSPYPMREFRGTLALSATPLGLARVARPRKAKP